MQDEYGPVLTDVADHERPRNERVAAPAHASGLKREVKVLALVLQDRAGRRKYEAMLAKGWSVDSTVPRTLSRAVTVTFSRLKLTRRERKLVGNYSRGNR